MIKGGLSEISGSLVGENSKTQELIVVFIKKKVGTEEK
jgi:hypothetical protein